MRNGGGMWGIVGCPSPGKGDTAGFKKCDGSAKHGSRLVGIISEKVREGKEEMKTWV